MFDRYENWEFRLREYFTSVAAKPFEWGKHDCCLFAAGAVLAMSGVDLAADFRGRYQTAAGSHKALRRYGAGTIEDTITAKLGEPKHIAQVKRGDIVTYQNAIGVCAGRFSRFIGGLDESGHPVVSDGEEVAGGLINVLTSECDHAWTVPFHAVKHG